MLFLQFLLLFGLLGYKSYAKLLSAGIVTDVVVLNNKVIEYVGFPQSAYNGTEVEIRLICAQNRNYKYAAQFVIRSSPCDKEFFDARRQATVRDLLVFYFTNTTQLVDYSIDNIYLSLSIPYGYHYPSIVHYQSPEQTFDCIDDLSLFKQTIPIPAMLPINVTSVSRRIDGVAGDDAATELAMDIAKKRRKRQDPPSVNGDTIDAGTNERLSSFHPVIRVPIDGIYFLVVKLRSLESADNDGLNISVKVQWRGPFGYLSAIDYPLLPFYGITCLVYAFLALIWLIFSIKYWQDLLRIQFWIGAVILLGMVEKAVFYSEYATMNATGTSVDGAIEMAELVSCLKRTLARMLIIIVSVGFGVVKPRLGSTLHQVVGVGFVYFVLSSIESIMRVSKKAPEAAKEKQLAALPLVMLEVGIFWWIFTSLVNTMRALRLRRNEVKLALYRHFTNTLCFAVIASIIYMCWSLYQHVFTECLKDWKELWVDTAFWHVQFCAILLVIMILWRPSNNNQRYAFTPLLDCSEDENDDDDVLFNSDAFTNDVLKYRQQMETKAENRKQRDPDQDELKWVEQNIPSSMADKLIADSDEEEAQTRFELSKMQ